MNFVDSKPIESKELKCNIKGLQMPCGTTKKINISECLILIYSAENVINSWSVCLIEEVLLHWWQRRTDHKCSDLQPQTKTKTLGSLIWMSESNFKWATLVDQTNANFSEMGSLVVKEGGGQFLHTNYYFFLHPMQHMVPKGSVLSIMLRTHIFCIACKLNFD